jgi:hypothetical protein
MSTVKGSIHRQSVGCSHFPTRLLAGFCRRASPQSSSARAAQQPARPAAPAAGPGARTAAASSLGGAAGLSASMLTPAITAAGALPAQGATTCRCSPAATRCGAGLSLSLQTTLACLHWLPTNVHSFADPVDRCNLQHVQVGLGPAAAPAQPLSPRLTTGEFLVGLCRSHLDGGREGGEEGFPDHAQILQ